MVEELHKHPQIVRIHNILPQDDMDLLVRSMRDKLWNKMSNYEGFWDEHRYIHHCDLSLLNAHSHSCKYACVLMGTAISIIFPMPKNTRIWAHTK